MWHSALPALPVEHAAVPVEDDWFEVCLGGGGGCEVGLAPDTRRLARRLAAWNLFVFSVFAPSALSVFVFARLSVRSCLCLRPCLSKSYKV